MLNLVVPYSQIQENALKFSEFYSKHWNQGHVSLSNFGIWFMEQQIDQAKCLMSCLWEIAHKRYLATFRKD